MAKVFDTELEDLLKSDDSVVGLESYIDNVNAELDAALLGSEIAQESLFGKPKTVEELIAKVQKNVAKLKTAEACDDLLAKLKTEEGKYNESLKGMKAAAQELAAGKIDKKELAAKIAPFAKELKNTCDIISLGQITEDKKNVTDDEIKKLRDFIVGAKKVIADRKAELEAEPVTEATGIDGFLSALDAAEIAEESTAFVAGYVATYAIVLSLIMAIRTPEQKAIALAKSGALKKEISKNIKDAKSAIKGRDYTGAIASYENAKKGYDGMIQLFKKLPDLQMAGEVRLENGKSVAVSLAKAQAINWAESKKIECDNAISKINAKKEKSAAKANKKADKKAAKATESTFEEAMHELDFALESMTGVTDNEDDEAIDDIDDALEDDDDAE